MWEERAGLFQEKLHLSAKGVRESHQRVSVHVTGKACSSRVVTRTESRVDEGIQGSLHVVREGMSVTCTKINKKRERKEYL